MLAWRYSTMARIGSYSMLTTRGNATDRCRRRKRFGSLVQTLMAVSGHRDVGARAKKCLWGKCHNSDKFGHF